MRSLQIRILLVSLFVAVNAFAGGDDSTVAIPKDRSSAPAIDLMYGGTRIGRDQAAQLRENGYDLSTMDPEMNDLWQPRALPVAADSKDFPAEGSTVTYGTLKDASLFYRAQVTAPNGTAYFLVIDLNNHRSLATSALMRKLGYAMDPPKFYHKLHLKFANLDEYEDFMGHEKKGDHDQASPGDVVTAIGKDVMRWVIEAHPETFEVVLQDVNLESARVTVPRYYQGVVRPEWIQGRRSARAAIVPLALLNFNLFKDSINLYSWELGHIEAERILLKHPYADAFMGTGIEDARWIARKIAALTRQDWIEILNAAELPSDVTALLVEKALARRNQLIELVDLKNDLPGPQRELPYSTKLNVGSVRKGEVQQENYPGYAARFTVGDPESPLRWSEIRHYLKLEGIAQALAGGATKLNEKLQFAAAKEGVIDHIMDVYKQAIEWQMKHPGEPYVVPVQTWAKPLYGMSVNASRNVVTGTYYGSDSKVQLVDSISIGASVGGFGGLDGKAWAYDKDTFTYKAMGSAAISYQRNYTHVRPIPSLESTKKEKWTHLMVPFFMRHLGKIVDSDVITKGDEAVKKALQEFLSDIREGEVFTITDTYSLRGGPNYTIPLTALMGPGLTKLAPNVGIGITGEFAILKRVMITRRNGHIEVYDNKMKTRSIGANVDLNAWINIARVAWQKKNGEAETDAMMIDLDSVTADDLPTEDSEGGDGQDETAPAPSKPATNRDELSKQRKRLLRTLNVLFRHNELDSIRKYSPPMHLEHEMKSRLLQGKLLLWSWNNYQATHKVTITPPADPEHPFDPKAAARTLYSVRKVQLKGKDPYGFFGQIASRASKVGGLFASDGNLNPAGTFLGKSNWTSITTEAELTPSAEFEPLVEIDDYHSGWYLKREKLLEIMDAIEADVKVLNQDTGLFRRDVFNSMDTLQAYEIHSSVLIFPEGVSRLEKLLFGAKDRRELLIRLMDLSQTTDLRNRCQKYLASRGLETELEQLEGVAEDSKLWNRCIEPWMRRVMKWVRKAPTHERREEYAQWMNRTIDFLQRKASLTRTLKRIGADQYFFRLQVSGFRTKDENGDSAYVADSIGTIPNEAKRSPFHDLKVWTSGSDWTLLDYETNARYFGSGL